jgi:hypothetical protein
MEVVSFMLKQLYLWGKMSHYPLGRRLFDFKNLGG